MSNMPLDTFLSLEQTAMLSIAKAFWDLPQVKKRVLILTEDSLGDDKYNSCYRWMKLIEELLPARNSYPLLDDFERHLLNIIKEVGRKIFVWVEWTKPQTKYRRPRIYTAKDATMIISSIRWTPCGIVDEFKTYQALSEMDPDFDIVELYRVACMHAMEDQINYLWKRMSESERKSFEYFVSQNRNCMAAYWQYRRDNHLDAWEASVRPFEFLQGIMSNVSESIKPYFSQLYDEHLSVDECMILISLYHGLINAVKYFWHRLPEDYKIDKLFDYLHLTLMLYIDYKLSKRTFINYRKDRLARVCVFFISQMNDDHKEIFQRTTTAAAIFEKTHKINVSRMELLLRPAWPWDNFVSLGLKDLIHRRKFSNRLARYLLCELTTSEVEQFKGGLVVNGSEIQSSIQEIWKSLPRKQKEDMIEPYRFFFKDISKRFIFNLVDARDFETLRVIVNESEMSSVRDQLVYSVLKWGESWIETDDYELLEELINHLATSSEERLSFRSYVDCLDYFIKREEYDLADKFLDWKAWKPQMNKYAKKRRLMDLKRTFRYNSSPEYRVCNLWVDSSKNIDEAMQRSSRLINWVFMTKKERDRFIGEKLATSSSRTILENHKLSTEVIEKFFYWCKLAQKEPFMNVKK